MPRVPYNPVPEVAPTEAATPSVRISANPDAFGANIGQAIQGLGAATSQVGNELFGRAVALQELQNETDAKNANVDFISKAGQLHADYDALQGDARVKAFPAYQKNLNDLYQSTRGGLGNPSAQRMFDGAAISTLNRSIFNGAGAAASAQREAASGAINAEEGLIKNNVYSDPNDEGAFREAIQKIKDNAPTKAALSNAGGSPEVIAKMQQDGINDLAYHRIVGMARNQPGQAYSLLSQYEKEGLIVGQHDLAARQKVESYISTNGMDTIAQNVMQPYTNSDGTFTKSASDMEAEVVAQAKKLYPDIPNIETAAQKEFRQNYYMHNFIKTQNDQQFKSQLDEQIMKGVTNHNLLPPNIQQQMRPEQIKQFDTNAFNYQKAQRTRTDDAVYQKYWGMYHNDKAAFMDVNVHSIPDLSQGSMNKLLQLQRTTDADGDPRVSRAMNWIKGANPQILDDLGVTGKGKDPETANQFVGALHEAIQSYQETNGKAPDEKTLTGEIFPAVTRQITQKGWIYNSQTPFFALPIPDKYKEDYLKINPNATDPEIHQNYNRQMFDQFFKGQKASKDQSRVGQ